MARNKKKPPAPPAMPAAAEAAPAPAPPDPRTTNHRFEEDEEDDLCHVCRARADDPIHRSDLQRAIARGPKWHPIAALSSVGLILCATECGLVERVDRDTGLCLVCWRIWRWTSAGFPARAPCWPDA